MVNLNGFQNISPINLNTSVVTGENVVQKTTSLFVTSVPYWLLPVTLIFFITMTWFIYKKLTWGLDIIQSALVASLFNMIISYSVIKVGWSVSIVPLTIWGVIWILLLIIMFYIKIKR